jgi:hypothetical protein
MPQSSFRDPHRLATWVTFLFSVYVALLAAGIFSDVLQLQLLASASFTREAEEANDLRQRVIAILSIAVFFTCAIVFARLVYRANANARHLGATGMRNTPGWAVGWYLVPIAFFWKPYQAMKEIRRASKNPAGWQTEPWTAALPWWWFFWVLTCLIGNVAFRLSMAARTIETLTVATWFNLVAAAVSIPSAILAVSLVREISAMQRGHALQSA